MFDARLVGHISGGPEQYCSSALAPRIIRLLHFLSLVHHPAAITPPQNEEGRSDWENENCKHLADRYWHADLTLLFHNNL